MSLTRHLLCCLLFLTVFSRAVGAQDAPLGEFQKKSPEQLSPRTVGRLTVAWTPANGLSLAVDGVPVVRKSLLYVVKEGWKGVLFDQTQILPQISEESQGDSSGVRIVQENEFVSTTYTLQLGKDGDKDTLDVILTYRLKRDIPAEIEWGAGYLSGPVLQGSTLTGNVADVPILPLEIPIKPPLATRLQEENRLTPPFTDLRFATRLGVVSLTYDGTAPRPVIFDARSDSQAWAQEFPVFWMGLGSPAQPVKFADGEKTAHFRFVVAPAASSTPSAPVATGIKSVLRSPVRADAFVPFVAEMPRIIPTPKKVTRLASGPRFVRLNAQTKLVVCDETAGTRRAVAVLQNAIVEQFGWKLPIVTKANVKTETNAIYIGVGEKTGPSGSQPMPVPQKPEGYAVRGNVIAGRDAAGVLWGAQTFVQVLGADSDGPLAHRLMVEDWPTLAVRGVHIFHGQNALPFHKKLIDRVLSRFKINTMVIQAEQVRWNHDPEVAPNWAGTPDAVQAEIAFARERGITVYPLVQSYGHMEWLFNKEKNRSFAEDPETPYAVNFTDTKAVSYLEGFNTEADKVFNAPAFHIGLDEVTMRGRFPYRSKPKEFAELFIGAATHWNDFFKKRGKPVWMWADMALHPSEVRPSFGTAPTPADAARIRAGLPKDIVMIDWQYGGHSRFPSLQKLKDAGFQKLIAATWFNPTNIQNFSRAAAEVGAWGALQTTWCGYESKESVLETKERRQFEAMVLAAEYFWNGGEGPTPDTLPYTAAEVFAAQWGESTLAENSVHAGWTLRFSESGTRPLADPFGYGLMNATPDLKPGQVRLLDGTLAEPNANVVLLKGKLNLPGEDLPVDFTLPTLTTPDYPVQTMRLLLAASHISERGSTVGTVTVTYTDGTKSEIPLIYGKNIAAWVDGSGLPAAPTVWKGSSKLGQPLYLRRLEVNAPAGKVLQSVTLTSANGSSAPVLFAATALTGKAL